MFFKMMLAIYAMTLMVLVVYKNNLVNECVFQSTPIVLKFKEKDFFICNEEWKYQSITQTSKQNKYKRIETEII